MFHEYRKLVTHGELDHNQNQELLCKHLENLTSEIYTNFDLHQRFMKDALAKEVLSPAYKEEKLDRSKIKDWRRPGAVAGQGIEEA